MVFMTLLGCGAQTAGAAPTTMKSYLIGATSNGSISASAARFTAITGNESEWRTASDDRNRTIWPLTGKLIKNLKVSCTTAPGAGKSFAYEIYSNGVATGVVATISDAATTASDLTHTFSGVAGEQLTLRANPSGTPTLPGRVMWNIEVAGSSQESAIMGHSTNADSTTLVRVCGLQGSMFVSTSAQVMPCDGTFSRLFVLQADPGGGNTRDLEIYKNGVATGLKVTLTSGNSSGSDTTNSFSVVQGDLVDFRSTPTAGTPTGARFGFGLKFAPSTDGESVLMGYTNGDYAGGTLYQTHGADGGDATEANRNLYMPDTTLKKLYQYNQTAPGLVASRTLRARVAGANGNLVATCTGAATTAADNSNTDTVTFGQVFDFLISEALAPAASTQTKWGVVMFTTP